jgi:hypothetical protein
MLLPDNYNCISSTGTYQEGMGTIRLRRPAGDSDARDVYTIDV